MKIKAIAPWFGSKRTMARDIAVELGPHSAYWEPFCGSISVLLAKDPSSQESVSDLHGDLINLARVLASDQAPELYERLSRVLYCQDLFERSRAVIESTGPPESSGDIDRAFHYFVLCWISRNGTAGCTRTNWQMAIRWTPNGGHSPLRFVNAIESIPAWHRRLRNVCIIQRDAFEVLRSIDDHPRMAIYVDPPYLTSTRGVGGGSRYQHDFDESGGDLFGGQDDHERLADVLRRFERARVVLSYYDHAKLDRLYPGWTKRGMYRQKNLHVQNRRGVGAKVAPEVLLLNGPSYASTAEET